MSEPVQQTATPAQTVTLTPIAGQAAYRINQIGINDQGVSVQIAVGVRTDAGVFNELATQSGWLSVAEATDVLAVTGADDMPAVDTFKTAVLTKLRALGRIKV